MNGRLKLLSHLEQALRQRVRGISLHLVNGVVPRGIITPQEGSDSWVALLTDRPIQPRYARIDGRPRLAEAVLGGPIAAMRDGDISRFDVTQRVLQVEISDELLRQRMKEWRAARLRYPAGVFAKYAALVSSASQGAIARPPK